MDLMTALNETYDQAHTVIQGVRADQLDNPTPCAEWDVRALLDHAIGVVGRIGTSVRSGQPVGAAEFVLSDDPATQFRDLADANLAAWRAPGAPDSTINGGAGPMPGVVLASINLVDTTTHTWDVAKATGQHVAFSDAHARFVLETAKQTVSPGLREGRFAPEVSIAGDAPVIDRLAAFLGRVP